MKEIKYRAWDKGRKEYLSNGNVFIGIDPGARPLKNSIYLDLIDYPDIYRERFVLEQYTGLRDKNGTEIYEGDIILVGRCQWKCRVVWEEECARFTAFTDKKDTGRILYYMFDKDDESDIEVIGNIYENPELFPTLNNN